MGLLRLFGISMLTVAAVYPTFVLADVAPIDYWSFRGRVSWGLEHPTERVIQTQRDFRKLWADIHTTPGEEGRGVPPAPELDFRKEMIIVIGMGRRSTGGYSIKIHSIRDVGDRVVVSYSTYSPGESCMTTQSITSPVELIRLRKSDKPVTLFATNEIAHCSR